MLKAEVIPYRNFKERMAIVRTEGKKGNKVEYDHDFVYSFPKINVKPTLKVKNHIDGKGSRTFKNFKCNSCKAKFRITSFKDVLWAMCPSCGGVNVEGLRNREEYLFEEGIK